MSSPRRGSALGGGDAGITHRFRNANVSDPHTGHRSVSWTSSQSRQRRATPRRMADLAPFSTIYLVSNWFGATGQGRRGPDLAAVRAPMRVEGPFSRRFDRDPAATGTGGRHAQGVNGDAGAPRPRTLQSFGHDDS